MAVCDEDQRGERQLVTHAVALRWLSSNVEFEQLYSQARELQAEFLGEEMLAISDEDEGDAEIRYRVDGVPYAAMNGRNVQRAKLMADSRKWLMAKLARHRYGDNIDVTSAGKALAAPVVNNVTLDARVQSIMLLASARRAGLKMID